MSRTFKDKLREITENKRDFKRKSQLPQKKFWRRYKETQEVSHFFRSGAISRFQ